MIEAFRSPLLGRLSFDMTKVIFIGIRSALCTFSYLETNPVLFKVAQRAQGRPLSLDI